MRPADGDHFTWRDAGGQPTTTSALSRFVTTRAAAYLFFPSLTGLRYISQLPDQARTEHQQDMVEEAVSTIVQGMRMAIGDGTTRDAHTKHHGLVTATFTVRLEPLTDDDEDDASTEHWLLLTMPLFPSTTGVSHAVPASLAR